jgi:hypothetical protein
MKSLAVALAFLTLTGCMSTKMALDPKWNPSLRPAYVDYADYWVFGLFGHGEFNLQKICVDQNPYGFQQYRSAEDGLIALFTAGIYAPATLRVWCGN